MKAEQNELITRIGPHTPCGNLMRHYWQPVALVDEFNPELAPAMAVRPVKAVQLLGQNLVLFRNRPTQAGEATEAEWALLDRDCPHRGADLSFGRLEETTSGSGLRCPFHGWKFDAKGQCVDTPAEPSGSKLCERVKQRSYPVIEKSGVLFAWMGPEGSTPPPFAPFDCFTAPGTHTFAFKGLWACNWLQAFEVGIDPAHASFLHRFFKDESLDEAYGRQFRGASAGSIDGKRWPMTRVMREFDQPEISFESTDYGMQITALRALTPELTHVRVTNAIFPHAFVIPLSEHITITQFHVPVDDTHTYWYAIFTSFTEPLNKEAMRNQRLKAVTLPDYIPISGRHNNWGFDPQEQIERTYLGMGEDDINVHDQWACESMGAIADRTREHLGTTDKVIMANRRVLLKAIETVQAAGIPPGVANAAIATTLTGPDTVDGIAPAAGWDAFWRDTAAAKRAGAPWLASHAPAPVSAKVVGAATDYSPHTEAS
ncbi:aromatic ring-hydroxylating dioxygenase subunit alpha [Rhodoferax sp.]|uniref:aromatic ring-hydroxylating dioxygenase subunit alpha n=1 Tax=Rhodoferax sp. TaxID=50421 RepID=UPI001EBA3160|nr:aromatic ring-hydroxylating dioxygenase subunit alpha [Rhodoferax sp.]MBT9506575.1 aromatic ring-hydroxylating dioxygenase subunit alpha [Rhodoferax sp.]